MPIVVRNIFEDYVKEQFNLQIVLQLTMVVVR